MDMGFCLDQKSGIWVKNSRLQLKNANIFWNSGILVKIVWKFDWKRGKSYNFYIFNSEH
jgi:hypothetical protein